MMKASTLPAWILTTLVAGLWSCSDEPDVCGPGDRFDVSGQNYCLYTIIEDGFLCPESEPFQHDYRDLVVCASEESLAVEVFAWIDDFIDQQGNGQASDAGVDANFIDRSTDDVIEDVPDLGSDSDSGADAGGGDVVDEGGISVDLVSGEDTGGDDVGSGTSSAGASWTSDGLGCGLALAAAEPAWDCSAADINTDEYVLLEADLRGDLVEATLHSFSCGDLAITACYDVFENTGSGWTNSLTFIIPPGQVTCDNYVEHKVTIDLRRMAQSFAEASSSLVGEVQLVTSSLLGDDVIELLYTVNAENRPIDCCQSLGSDAFSIGATSIESDQLITSLSFSGGCAEHDFFLCAEEPATFLESNPVQLDLIIAHNGHNDPCTSVPTEERRFDLTGVRNLFDDFYPDSPGAVILRLNAPDEQRTDILYNF